MYLYKEYGIPIIRDSGYSILITDRTLCLHCGTCISRCQFDAVSLNDDGPITNTTRCMGCGLCVSTYPLKIRKLVPK